MGIRFGRLSVDAWLENFLRVRSWLENPSSTAGGQLAALARLSSGSDGVPFGAKTGYEIPCRDDSAAHNAAHRADAIHADHGADLLIWASLEPDWRLILEMQRSPVKCPARTGQKPVKIDVKNRDDAAPRSVLACSVCESSGPVKCPDSPVKVRSDAEWSCEHCHGSAVGHFIIDHNRCIRLKVERKIDDRREGDGSELIEASETGGGWWWMYVWEPAQVRNDQIAEYLRITVEQLHGKVKAARARIREKLGESEEETS